MTTAKCDGLFHEHADRELIGVEEEVTDKSDVAALSRGLDDGCDGVALVALQTDFAHQSMSGRCFATKTAGLDAFV